MRAQIDNSNECRLSFGGKEIVLLGTAHVSKESVEQVKEVLLRERPDTVCVELCASRYQAVVQKDRWENTDLLKVIKEKKASLLLLNLMLAHFQKKIGQKLGIKPGQEILEAIQGAEKVGARLHLADRDVRVTLTRALRVMSLWRKVKLIFHLIVSAKQVDSIQEEDIERMKRQDVLETLVSEMGESFPEIRRTLIDERDQYLSQKIRSAPGDKIVAVVGAGHVPGIQKYWREDIDLTALEQLPPKGSFWPIMQWALPALIIGMIVIGFFSAGAVAGRHMIKWWILANAVLAGSGAALALAHPLTVLSAVVASPLTSLNPMIAAGWVSGLVEALLGKPKVKDFQDLPLDITTVRGFWKNKITRILLVVVFTNIGSSIGTFVAIPLMIRVFT